MKRKIVVVGLGYVGLPLALLFHQKDYHVIGIDVDEDKLVKLREGRSYISDISDDQIGWLNASGSFEYTGDFSRLSESEAIIICVPTPLSESSDPDLSYLKGAMQSILPHLRPQQLIVVESSTYPGTTEEEFVPLLEQHQYTVGEDVFVGYSPERIDPGNLMYSLENIAKVVSGATAGCLERIVNLYQTVFRTIVPVSSTKAAEMTKLLENTYRFINISFINEIGRLCEGMGIDVWEVIEAAATKPYGFTSYDPGPGIGGHCIPVDPLYLKWKANLEGMETPFIDLAKSINDSQPAYVMGRIKQLLAECNRNDRVRILQIGLAYKANIADLRESPSISLFQLMVAQGYEVDYHDPFIPSFTVSGHEYHHVPLSEEVLNEYDCVVIATAHQSVDYEMILRAAPLIFDTRHCYELAYSHVAKL